MLPEPGPNQSKNRRMQIALAEFQKQTFFRIKSKYQIPPH